MVLARNTRAIKVNRKRQLIINFLATKEKPQSCKDVASALKWSSALTRYHLNNLCDRGLVETIIGSRRTSWGNEQKLNLYRLAR